jgi:hypothetical protein
MTLQLELPATMSETTMPEGWFDHMQIGWRATVDRLVYAVSASGRSARRYSTV